MSDAATAFAPLSALSDMLRRGAISARELIELYVARARRHDARARAFITRTDEAARAEAALSDARRAAGECRGGLDGIPFASKDLIDVAGVPTTGGSRVLAESIAEADAFVIARMRAAGAVSLGKLNLHEFAYGATGENPIHGTAVNAYDESRLAGGSSSGSAAAVAFGLAPMAFGTDTGGSVRVPAALNGLVGLKPTIGRISTRGVLPYCWSLDHVGVICRSVADAATILAATAGFDPRDQTCANEPVDDYGRGLGEGVAGLRVGVPDSFFFERADGEILAASEAVLRHLETAGARLIRVEMPSMAHARTVSLTVQMPEALSYHARYLEARGDLYGEDFRAGLALGQCLLAEHYVRAKRFIAQYRMQTNALFADVDVIATPAAPVVAPKLGAVNLTIDGVEEPVGNAMTRYTTFFNMTGHPAITVPSGMHAEGLPMGVQIVGRHFAEATVLRVAAAIERDERFRVRRPPGLDD